MQIFVCDDIFKSNAGSPRQRRQLLRLLQKYSNVILVTEGKEYFLKETSNLKKLEAENLKKRYNLPNYPKIIQKILRFLKQDLLLYSITLVKIKDRMIVRRLQKTYQSSHVIYSSPTFPFWAKGSFSIDMRDPWGTHSELSIFKFHRKFLEKRVLRRAKSVSVVCKGMQTDLFNSYGVNSLVEYNYIDELDESYHLVDKEIFEKLDPEFCADVNCKDVFVYTGSVPDGFYDLKVIKQRLLDYMSRNDDVILYLVGPHFAKLKKIFEDPRVKLRNSVNRNVACTYIYYSSGGILFGHKIHNYLTAKIFEYIYFKKKILLVNNMNPEMIDVLKQNKLGFENL